MVAALTAKSASHGTTDIPKPYLPAVKITGNITLTGKMDDPLWLHAMPVELNWEIMPGENQPAKQKTTAWVLYNDDYLYFGFRCYDSVPSAIRSNLSDRDKMFGDEFYDGHIFRNVTTVQFTRKLFIRAIGQYNTFDNAFNIYPLVSYKFNAFTMFCAGMTQDYQEYNIDESNFYKTTGHQYFVKLQYLFNL